MNSRPPLIIVFIIFLLTYTMELLFHFHKPTSFLLSLLLFSLTLFSYADQGPYFINCGSSSDAHLELQTFVGDVHPHGFHLSSPQSYTLKNTNYSAESLYQTARVFRNPSAYDFDISNGTYILRFHFYAFSSSPELKDALFDVSVGEHMLLSNFSVGKNTTNSPFVKEFILTPNPGKIRIYFVPYHVSSSLAFINAIEVLPINQNITEDTGPYVTPKGSNKTYNGQKSKILETMYRINVGGKLVTDSYFRKWNPDDLYLTNKNAAMNASPHQTGLDRVGGQSTDDDAPDEVYNTAKELTITKSKLTWQFSIKSNTTHFVRVHFCDIVSTQLTGKNFSLYIYNFEQPVDPFNTVNRLAGPFYMDYIVESSDVGVLNISIGPEVTDEKYAFLNGLEIMQVKNEIALEPTISEQVSHAALVIGLATAGGVAFVIMISVAVAFLFRKKRETKPVEPFEWAMVPLNRRSSSNNRTSNRSSSSITSLSNLHLGLKIPFTEIQRVTRNFDANLVIGEGGFGKVYKGALNNGTIVAVKRSNPAHGQGLQEFQAEIKVLSKIRHRHLVSLIGYCYEDNEMILVYEFMERGTLRDHLYDSKRSSKLSKHANLSWKQRLEICIGAAKGLEYLHTGSERGIIHRDVKSTNILLDENYVAKVADFGLSTSGHLERTHVSTDIKGTFGYLDPEYFRSWHLTEKSDIYSFGVVLLEVLCARPALDQSLPKEQVSLVDWGMACHKEGLLEKIIDPLLVREISQNSLKKYGETVAKCLKDNATERPPMSGVIWDLEYTLQLQKTAAQMEQQDDSTTVSLFYLPSPAIRSFPSLSMFNNEDELPLRDSTTVEVFSQLEFDDSISDGR